MCNNVEFHTSAVTADDGFSYIVRPWDAPAFPLVLDLVFQREDVQVSPGRGRRPLQQQAFGVMTGNRDVYRGVRFH